MTLKKTSACVFAALLGLSAANAQQLPNASFDDEWVTCNPWVAGNYVASQGTQPTSWYAANVMGYELNLFGKKSWVGKTTVVTEAEGHNSAKAAKLENKTTVGNVIPGYLSLGTPWNTANTSGKNSDGGVFGGVEFTSCPDAIEFDYLRVQGSGSTQPASVVAYLWKGTTTQTNVPSNVASSATKVTMTDRDRNILGIEYAYGDEPTYSDDFELIATINDKITEANEDWTTVTIPFEYKSDATPAMINVVFSAMDYFADRSAHKSGDALTVDNVRMVYYSRLSSLSVNGEPVESFDSGNFSYAVDIPYSNEHAVEATVLGKSAAQEINFDDENHTATVKVSNVDADSDGEASHSYVIQFAEPEQEETGTPVEVASADYKGTITIDLGMGDPASLDDQIVKIASTGVGTCDFALDHFSLDGEFDMGNIRVNDVKTIKAADSDNIIYTGSATNITLNLDETTEIYADVDLEGTEDAAHNLSMKIHVRWLMNGADDHETYLPIEVEFNGSVYVDPGTSGIDAVNADSNEAPRYFLINGVEVKDASAAGLYIVRRGNKVEKLIVK